MEKSFKRAKTQHFCISLQYDFVRLDSSNVSESDGVTVKITLLRIFTHHLVNTFLPTACLIVIAEMTLFIDTTHFEATIMVALTSMLVMYTLYQSISATLPQTAYIKMIDAWLLAGLILPFIVFIILVLVDTKRLSTQNTVLPFDPDEGEKSSAEKLLKWAKLFIPLLTLMFFCIYAYVAGYFYSCQ